MEFLPNEKLSISLTSNVKIYSNNNIMIAALSFYYGKPFTIPTFTKFEIKPNDLALYAGNYASED